MLAQTPYDPSTDDYEPDGGKAVSGVVNTGTDIMDYYGKTLQVMTWDQAGGDVVLSWAVGNGGTSKHLVVKKNPGEKLSDPDVVVGFNGPNRIVAAMVYIVTGTNGYGRTHIERYEWDPGAETFSAIQPRVALGSVGVTGALRDHSHPNIDGNSRGNLGIVWQETTSEEARVTVVSPSYPTPGFSYTQQVTFSQAYGAYGTLSGSIGCSLRGTLVSGEPSLLEQSLNPDVAISEGQNQFLSYTYIRHFVDATGNYSIHDNLAVKQYPFDRCPYTEVASYEWGGVSGTPRIAASGNPQLSQDVEIAINWASGACVPRVGPVSYYGILNFGKSQGTFRPAGTSVTNNAYINNPAAQPVVAYYGNYGETKDSYIITWAGADYETGQAYDIWGRTLRNGDLEPTGQGLSRVNMRIDGNQVIPSVAGRHLTIPYGAGHLFVDEGNASMVYKMTRAQAGIDHLRTASQPGRITPEASPIDMYPNPFTATVDFRLALQPNEKISQIIITDLVGREQGRLTGKDVIDGQLVHWKPGAKLPSGNYVVKMITNQRTESRMLKKE
ncbi:T9SS type A sorting domain-containing protein [Hymenobacter busanensis]|uniref:T9SS type A sorting domain-containing protein n=1 Tax=Hymenobacter busanensis TaxID=2607656 RepID=UPI0013676CA1|nr:T9SS type A sorting domain-containing protein [Hymenobacter busanensis]QHJ08189.1 T9SS type A sorting domain-containing protein [Hymenobacter busanensis]